MAKLVRLDYLSWEVRSETILNKIQIAVYGPNRRVLDGDKRDWRFSQGLHEIQSLPTSLPTSLPNQSFRFNLLVIGAVPICPFC